jgi:AcrR family transcriptional regulator
MAERRAKGAERERTVVAAAATLIAERGMADLRMTDVAQRAGMSVGHVTYYFPSKSQLLLRAITESEREFQAQAEAALAEHSDHWTRLCRLVELATPSGHRDRGWLLWFEVWASAGVDDEVAEAQRALDRWWRDSMRQIMTEGVEAGRFTCDDVDSAVSIVSALTDGLSVRLTLDGSTITRTEVLDLVNSTARQLLGVTD